MLKPVIGSLITALTFSFLASAATPPTNSATDSYTESYYGLSGGRKAAITLKKSAATTDWLVFMPGSNTDFYVGSKSRWINWVTANRDFNTLVINKAGVRISGDANLDEYQFSSVRERRISDTLTILKNVIPSDARILLMAESEGGYLVADVALADPRVKAVIDISGNTQSWITEEIMYLPEGPEREKARAFFDKEVIGVLDDKKFYSGWNYVWLNSMHTRKAYESMKALTIPVLWMNGEKDDVLWVEGARQDAMSLLNTEHKTNIEYHWILGASHGLGCPAKANGCDGKALASQVTRLLQTFTNEKF